jgi:hypothetical protein
MTSFLRPRAVTSSITIMGSWLFVGQLRGLVIDQENGISP